MSRQRDLNLERIQGGNYTMTAKQYLKQAYRLNELINSDLEEVAQLRTMVTSISSLDIKSDVVSSSKNTSSPFEKTIIKILDLENKINVEIDQYIDLKNEIKDQINAIEQSDLRLILQKRYLNFQKWEQIAVDMNYGYQWIHKLHNIALVEFSKKNKQAIESDI